MWCGHSQECQQSLDAGRGTDWSPTLCDPIDGSPSGSAVPGILCDGGHAAKNTPQGAGELTKGSRGQTPAHTHQVVSSLQTSPPPPHSLGNFPGCL